MLYIMRHGKTDWNTLGKLQGRTDIPLNDEGRAMAEKARTEYRDVHFDVCYCSPLSRAKETAEIFLKGREIPILPDDRLVEMGFGRYEGMEGVSTDPDCPISVLFQEPERYTISIEESETFEQLFQRTGEFLNKVIYPQLAMERDILIVGHGAMNSSIVCQVKNIPIVKFWSAGIENCKLMRLI